MTNVRAWAWTGSRPAANISWYQAAAFVNWLNTSTGHHAAYDLTYSGGWSMNLWSSAEAWQAGGENLYRHKDAYYFLPGEDEWYKAAYHKNDGVTANYWDYAMGSNSIPDGIDSPGDPTFDAVFVDGYNPGFPYDVDNVGLPSPHGTYGQNGNIWEWVESAYDGLNDSSSEYRTLRGGLYDYIEGYLRASARSQLPPTQFNFVIGFRVASIPEPNAPQIYDVTMDVVPGKKSGYFTITNTGETPATFDLSASQFVKVKRQGPKHRKPSKPARAPFRLVYLLDGVDITAAIESGNAMVTLNPGASSQMVVSVQTRKKFALSRSVLLTLAANCVENTSASASAQTQFWVKKPGRN